MRPGPTLVLLLFAGFFSAGCSSGGGSGDNLGMFSGSRGGGSIPIPSDTRRGGREGLPDPDSTRVLSEAEQQAAREQALARAEALWRQAEAVEARDPEEAGDLFHDLAADYPISPRAAEAKYREGRAYARAGEQSQAFDALKEYMQVAPANPHLAECEELIYRAGVDYLAGIRGFFAFLRSEEPGYRMLDFVATTFPNGRFADDALLALGNAYRREDDKDGWIEAATTYKRLLLAYPESPLVPEARLGLAEVYLVRDQGDAYHGGYVDLDPREKLPDDPQALANAGPVVSGPGRALAQYEELLAQAQRQPGFATAEQVAAATRGAAEARARLAAKDRRIASWYAGRGAGQAAAAYTGEGPSRTRVTAPPAPAARPAATPTAPATPPSAPPVPPGPAPTPPPAPTPGPVAPPTTPPAPPTPFTPAAAPTPAPGTLPPPAVRRLTPPIQGSVR